MKVLVTGGSGFIGSHLTDTLLNDGHEVIVIDNYETGRRDNLSSHKNLTIIENTIADKNVVLDIFNAHKIDIVVHAAASYKNPDNWYEDSLTNVIGTVNIVQAALKTNVKRIIYFQTALCYGTKPLEHPITLNHPILPEGSSYSISKTTAEQYIHLSGIDYVTFRLANVYGPRNVSGPLPTFYHRISENKKCFVVNTKRDFVYIDDLVNVVMKAIYGTGSGTYHISSGSDIAIKELWDETLNALEVTYDVEEKEKNVDDAPSILLDPTETENTFKWKTNVTVHDGVKKTIEYYKKYGVNETYTHLSEHK